MNNSYRVGDVLSGTVFGFMTSDWRPPNKDIDKIGETANVGLDASVGYRAPARQSGGRRFKFCSSKFFFVHPNLSKTIFIQQCNQEVCITREGV